MDEEINVRSLYWQIDDLSDKLAAKTTEVNQLRQLLELTQDSARMAAVVTDPRAMMTPGKAVEAFNRYFPEIKRLLDGTGE